VRTNIQIDEYYEHHQNVPEKVQTALRSVGIRNLSLWYWGSRMFYYAEYVSEEPFDEAYEMHPDSHTLSGQWRSLRLTMAVRTCFSLLRCAIRMARYAKMDGVKEWEETMHKYQKKLPGSTGDVWWQPMTEITHQD